MRRAPQSVLVLLLAAATAAAAGEVIDRVVAVVNRLPILQSEWDDAVRFERLMAGRPLDTLTEAERERALDRLIDQRLVEERMQAVGFGRASQEQVSARVAELRAQFPEAATDQAWQALLAQYGLSEEDVADRVAAQLNVLRFIGARFRPGVYIERAAIEKYYREVLVPQVERQGVSAPALREVAPKIEELLVEQRVSELMEGWLDELRAQSSIERRAPAAARHAEVR